MNGSNIVFDATLKVNLLNGLNGIEQLIKDRNRNFKLSSTKPTR